MKRQRDGWSGDGDRNQFQDGCEYGVSPVLGVVIMVSIVVMLGAATYVTVSGFGGSEVNALASVTTEKTTILEDDLSESDCTVNGEKVGEKAFDVTLSSARRVDTVYVIGEDGDGSVVWSNPKESVGETKRVANEALGNGGTDVDIGGDGDWSLCPTADGTFRFFAEYNGKNTTIQTLDVGT